MVVPGRHRETMKGRPVGSGFRFLRPAIGMGTLISQAGQWRGVPDFSDQPVGWGPLFLRPAHGVRTPVPQAGQWLVCRLCVNENVPFLKHLTSICAKIAVISTWFRDGRDVDGVLCRGTFTPCTAVLGRAGHPPPLPSTAPATLGCIKVPPMWSEHGWITLLCLINKHR